MHPNAWAFVFFFALSLGTLHFNEACDVYEAHTHKPKTGTTCDPCPITVICVCVCNQFSTMTMFMFDKQIFNSELLV